MNVPVVLENEANLSAVFEQDFGTNKETRDLITISIHHYKKLQQSTALHDLRSVLLDRPRGRV